jgi:hypothetical protein
MNVGASSTIYRRIVNRQRWQLHRYDSRTANPRSMTMNFSLQRRRLATLSTIALSAAVLSASVGIQPAIAQTSTAPAGIGLPNVPVTRVLAIGRLTAKSNPAAMRGVMPDEVRETVQLYLSGKVADWYTRKDVPGVVFVLDVRDLAEARALLEALPLGRAGLMDFDLIPLGPLAPLAILAGKP